MALSSMWRSKLITITTTLCAIAVTTVVAGYFLTDIPVRIGLAREPVSTDADHQQDSHGHSHADDSHGHSHASDADDHSHADDADDHSHADDSDGHSHADDKHEPHGPEDTIELSAQARDNLGLRTEIASVGNYTKYIETPAMIVDWPGRTHFLTSAPLTGVINAIYVSRGEMIESGHPLFSLRLTHQDLVSTQQAFLTSLGKMDVEQREITRLTAITNSGAVARKTLIQREYERDKLLAEIRAVRQSMLLHGLSEEQVAHIENTRELIREVTVHAPILHADRSIHHDSLDHGELRKHSSRTAAKGNAILASLAQPPLAHPEHVEAEFLVTEVRVSLGESVEAGLTLAQLSDYSQVLIEGHAFQQDGSALREAANSNLALQAVLQSASAQPQIIEDLRIVYIGNSIDPQTRALPYYVSLQNDVERKEQRGEQSYVSWRYKTGQRLKLRVPVGGFSDAIVLPKDALVEEGPERYVFVEDGDHFDRRPVRVLARDSVTVALANDGSIKPGQSIAVRGVHQMQMALKNKAGGAVDPHAGHSH